MAQREDFETTDGSTPAAVPLSAATGRRLPLSAFLLLSSGDVFEQLGGKPPADGAAKARAYVEARVEIAAHGAPPAQVDRVRADIVRQLSGNPTLAARMMEARRLTLDLVPPGRPMSAYGYPKVASQGASGLFWDHPSWPRARMALRQDFLDGEPHLVFHELAHAVEYLAFTEQERERIYAVMLPTWGRRAAVDEVFAIYSEREFAPDFSPNDLRAPGIYGLARARWNEQHAFTRFVRNLYFPHRPLAGPPSAGTF
jgi:hypothetical protein